MSIISYRTEIDGLRALAILPVVFYHLGLSIFPGGFVGVDVFFVISGFLITGIIVKEIEQKRFSLINFYEKRARRLMPALFGVLIFVLIFSPFFLAPPDYNFLPIEVGGVLLFCSNIISFLKSGYFTIAAAERPLLHTWSLGIEEQFYLFLPIILLVSIFLFKRKYGLVILLLTVCSFLASIVLTEKYPASSFYLLHTRFWELSVGSLCAIYINYLPKNNIFREISSFLGVILILISISLFNKELVFPGYIAALPVIGTALILCFSQDTFCGKFLSNKIFVFFGLISYSLYLWHWPLIVFSKDTYLIDLKLNSLFIFLLSVLLAWLSYKFIETPFRDKEKYNRRKIFSLTFLGYFIVLLLSGASYFIATHWSNRLGPEATKLLEGLKDYSPKREQCHFGNGVPSSDRYCILGKSGVPDTIVWGDSHGAELGYALSQYTSLYSVTYSSCSPARNYEHPNRPHCVEHNKAVLNFILNNDKLKNIIIAARYDTKEGKNFVKYSESQYEIIELLKAKGKNIIMPNEIPTPKFSIPQHLAKNKDVSEKFSYKSSVFHKLQIDPSVTIVRYQDILCKNNMCPLYINGGPLLFDDQHMSVTASTIVAEYIYKHHLK